MSIIHHIESTTYLRLDPDIQPKKLFGFSGDASPLRIFARHETQILCQLEILGYSLKHVDELKIFHFH